MLSESREAPQGEQPRKLAPRLRIGRVSATENACPKVSAEGSAVSVGWTTADPSDLNIYRMIWWRVRYFFGCGRLAGGTIPFIRRYSTICP
jgi:hypothetical protein